MTITQYRSITVVLWLIHTARDRERDRDWDWGNDGFLYYAMYCTHYLVTGTGNHCYRARKRSLQRLCFHRCLSVHKDMGGRGACMAGGCAWQGECVGEMATAVGGIHPTGMHSCFLLYPSRSLSLSRFRSHAVCMSH